MEIVQLSDQLAILIPYFNMEGLAISLNSIIICFHFFRVGDKHSSPTLT